MKVSLVIPTYNNPVKLDATLDCILGSDICGLGETEVVVVDDGSPVSAEPLVAAKAEPPGFKLNIIRQRNSGPAAARNRGFRASQGKIVIFVDDDILVPPDLIRKHFDAHRTHPGTVIYGRCPLIEPEVCTPLYRYVVSRGFDLGEDAADEFQETETVASGQISFERAMFTVREGIYRDDLRTPAAEEYELAARLRERRIPILMGTKMVARHNHQVSLDSMCRQAFKHSKGCAEAAAKYPVTLDLQDLRRVIVASRPSTPGEGLGLVIKKAVKRFLCAAYPLSVIVFLVKWAERRLPNMHSLPTLYKVVIGLHGFAGMRAGFCEYSPAIRTDS